LTDPDLIAFFDRENLRSLPTIIRDLGKKMGAGQRSVTVHCEGTRSLTCRTPVKNLSGSFVDIAVKQNVPIVPVRFVGGLPTEPLEQRIDFPLGCGQQDYWFGKPILAEELSALRYRERREVVIEAINNLGPSNAEEEPLPPNPEFEAAAKDWEKSTATLAPYAVIFETLRQMENPGPEARRLLEAAKEGELRVADDAKGRWLAEVAQWLFGEHGPEVRVG
jgi:1-acyl-sn-glycerol-3-phosphate acyltransferase